MQAADFNWRGSNDRKMQQGIRSTVRFRAVQAGCQGSYGRLRGSEDENKKRALGDLAGMCGKQRWQNLATSARCTIRRLNQVPH
jgi:hypothetical protein